MSLVGFKGQNHPQQPRKDTVDDRWTPLNLWIPWNDRWGFTLDAAASDENHLCDRYYTLETDGLARSWGGERVWCNPPYSDIASWVKKAWAEWKPEWPGCSCPGGDSCGGFGSCGPRPAKLIVMLLPANRTEQRWWQDQVEPYRDRRPHGDLSVKFLPRRINFGSIDNLGAWSASSAPFGCALLVWESESRSGAVTGAA